MNYYFIMLASSALCILCFIQVDSFQPILPRVGVIDLLVTKKTNNIQKSSIKSKSKDDDNDMDDERTGMDDAFKSLDGLSDLDLSDLMDDDSSTKRNVDRKNNIQADAELLKSFQQRSSTTTSSSSNDGDSDIATEGEMKLYQEMFQELETEGEDGIYDGIMDEMTSSTDGSDSKSSRVLNDADGIGSLANNEEDTLTAVEISQDTDEFMKRALEEAMSEVKGSTSSKKNAAFTESILKDEDMMKEINAIFDRANERLLNSIAEIKNEQTKMSEDSATSRSNTLKDEEERLAAAEGSVSRLLDKVKEETLEVEKAMEDLQKAQQDLLDDPLMKAADMRSGGIVKQAALAGTLLFSFRSIGELILLSGPNGADHGVSAAIQAALAIAFAALLFFV